MTLERLASSPEHPLDAPLLTFDISALLTQIKQESPWQEADRNAITLLKASGLRAVLVTMHAGTVISSHHAEGPITVQVVERRLLLSIESRHVTLGQGQLLTLHPGIPHGLEAISACAYLLTIASETPHPAE